MAWPANLTAFYKLDESTGNRVDSKGGFHLTPTGNPGNATGKVGSGLDLLKASVQYASNSNTIFQPLLTHFSFAFWVKWNATTGTHALLSRGASANDATNAQGFSLLINSSAALVLAFASGGSTRVTVTSASFPNNVWKHIAVTFDRAANMTLYVDAVSVGSASISAQSASVSNTAPLIVGATSPNSGTPGNSATATVDELAIFMGTALSSGDVTEIYNKGIAGQTYPFSTFVPRRKKRVLGL